MSLSRLRCGTYTVSVRFVPIRYNDMRFFPRITTSVPAEAPKLAVVRNLPLDFREQARCGNERKIVSTGLTGKYAGESAAQVQRMDGMHVKADFAAVQMRQAALEYVYGQPFVRQGPNPGSKDIVVDAARKQRCLNRHMPGTEIQAQIPLETVFRLQILVPHLEAEGSFMFSVRASGRFLHVLRSSPVRPDSAPGTRGPRWRGT